MGKNESGVFFNFAWGELPPNILFLSKWGSLSLVYRKHVHMFTLVDHMQE